MHEYPGSVAAIVDDYLDRLQARLAPLPASERADLLSEIRSHIHEAYQNEPEADEVARILSVLRKLGEPTEVVAEHLPGSILRKSRKGSMPLYILGGVLIALFGIPLGFAGVGVLTGILLGLAGALAGYYAAAISLVVSGTVGILLGIVQVSRPEIWDYLTEHGFIHMDDHLFEFMGEISPDAQGLFLIALFGLLAVAGLAMLRTGRHLFQGLRFLFLLMLDWVTRIGRKAPTLMQRFMQGQRQPGFRMVS